MTIDLIVIGKTDSAAIRAIIDEYSRRINRYVKFSVVILPDVRATKKLPSSEQKILEGEMLLRQIGSGDRVILLDERGTGMRSTEFAGWLEKRMAAGGKRICFIVGGPYGFSESVYERADGLLSLSQMTFSHQIIRTMFTEQLYRAFTILNNEPYHND